MQASRRDFFSLSAAALSVPCVSNAFGADGDADSASSRLQQIQNAPVLQADFGEHPIIIDRMELLRVGGEYLVRVRSRDGAEGVIVANSSRFRDTYPIFMNRVAPFFAGKDARDIESLLTELYRDGSNYKWQGLAFWVCVAAAEMAILDLLGKALGISIAEMFGGPVRTKIPVYRASSHRGNRPEEEVEFLQRIAMEIGAKAVKFRLGGRMSNNRDSLPGRTEALIPMVRDAFGKDFTLYGDSNSSYDVPNAIRIGRLMEEHEYAFFEEPCPFDHLWETKQVTEKLTIPIAGGEQEFSMRRFRWSIENRVTDIVQPDLWYFGGFIRCTKVARMAEAAGMDCTLHMSGSGLGYLYVLHFASYVPNAGVHQEFKGTSAIPIECASSDLTCTDGVMTAPTGPGFGVTIDASYLAKGKLISKT